MFTLKATFEILTGKIFFVYVNKTFALVPKGRSALVPLKHQWIKNQNFKF